MRARTHLEARFLLVTHLLSGALSLLSQLSARGRRVWLRHPLFESEMKVPEKQPLSECYRSLWTKALRPLQRWTNLNPTTFINHRDASVYMDPYASLVPGLTDMEPEVNLRPAPFTPDDLPCPLSDFLLKFKSDVYNDSYKIRELATHHRHPWRGVSRKIGRSLTLFWKTTASLLKSHEILGMSDILHWTRASASNLARVCGSNLTFVKYLCGATPYNGPEVQAPNPHTPSVFGQPPPPPVFGGGSPKKRFRDDLGGVGGGP